MQQQIQKLNVKFNHFLRKNFPEIQRYDFEEIRKDIDEFIEVVENQNQLRADMSRAFCESIFSDSKINIMHVIAKFGTIEQVNKIVDIAGVAAVNTLDANRFTPLHYASINSRDDIVSTLINLDADRNATTSVETRKWHSIHFACRYGNLKVVKIFIELGVDKEIRTGFGLTPLHVACEFGKIEIVKYLLNLGVQKDPITINDNQNMTPLHYAVVGNFQALSELLLINGVDKNKCDIKGYSSLDIASRNNLLEIAKLLLRWGVKNIEDSYEIAHSFKNKEIKELIQKYINAKKCLFNKSLLKKLIPELIEMIGKFNNINVSEPIIKIFGNVEFNAFGIFDLTSLVGFFSKRQVDFVQFAEQNELIDLCDALDHIKEIMVNSHNQIIKISLENI